MNTTGRPNRPFDVRHRKHNKNGLNYSPHKEHDSDDGMKHQSVLCIRSLKDKPHHDQHPISIEFKPLEVIASKIRHGLTSPTRQKALLYYDKGCEVTGSLLSSDTLAFLIATATLKFDLEFNLYITRDDDGFVTFNGEVNRSAKGSGDERSPFKPYSQDKLAKHPHEMPFMIEMITNTKLHFHTRLTEKSLDSTVWVPSHGATTLYESQDRETAPECIVL